MAINAFPIQTIPPTADVIVNTPSGPVTSTNVQDAINEIAAASATPGGSNGQVQYNNAGALGGYTGTQVTALLDTVTTSAKGLVPPSTGLVTDTFRGNSTWGSVVGTPASDPLFLTQGFSLNTFNPTWHSFASTQNVAAKMDVTYHNADSVDPVFSNLEALRIGTSFFHADNTYVSPTFHKTTLYTAALDSTFFSAGQRFTLALNQHSYGMGDAAVFNLFHDFACGPISGDEGQGWTLACRMVQQTDDRRCTISNVHQALGNTTITPSITANKTAQAVAVASTVNINVGEWYVVERMPADADWNTEAVEIVAVGGGTITAKFRNNHPAGVTLTPALVMDQTNGKPGQQRVIVNLSTAATYSVGTITSTFGLGEMVGSGTAWANNMVGGDSINIGAISLAKDELTTDPGSVGYPYRSWYEIKQVGALGQLRVVSMSVANDQSYRSTRGSFPTTYVIRPAVRILRILSNLSTIVCDTTTTTWTYGDQCEIAVCPYPDVNGWNFNQAVYTPGATYRGHIGLFNGGPVPCGGFIGMGGQTGDKPWTADTGVSISDCHVGIGITGLNKGTVPDVQAIAIGQENPISWGSTKVWGGAFDRFFRMDDGASGGWDYNPPSYSGNPEANMSETKLKKSWLNMPVFSAFAKPYVLMDTARIGMFQTNLATPTRPIEVPVSCGGFVIDPDTTNGSTRDSCFHDGGMGTAGALSTASVAVTAANGVNGAFSVVPTSFIRITGPTGAFSISGFDMGLWAGITQKAGDGVILRVYNAVAFAMTILNNAGGGASDILTLTGANVVLAARTSFATFIYSGTDDRWILTGTN